MSACKPTVDCARETRIRHYRCRAGRLTYFTAGTHTIINTIVIIVTTAYVSLHNLYTSVLVHGSVLFHGKEKTYTYEEAKPSLIAPAHVPYSTADLKRTTNYMEK